MTPISVWGNQLKCLWTYWRKEPTRTLWNSTKSDVVLWERGGLPGWEAALLERPWRHWCTVSWVWAGGMSCQQRWLTASRALWPGAQTRDWGTWLPFFAPYSFAQCWSTLSSFRILNSRKTLANWTQVSGWLSGWLNDWISTWGKTETTGLVQPEGCLWGDLATAVACQVLREEDQEHGLLLPFYWTVLPALW